MPEIKVIQNKIEKEFSFSENTLISNFLTEHGYYVPHLCGGMGNCKKCQVVLNGERVLACRNYLKEGGTLLLPDKEEISSVSGGNESGILTENLCLCLDIGTTTLALALVSLDEKTIIKTVTSSNPQRVFGADVISRIDYCTKNGAEQLQSVVIEEIQKMIDDLLQSFNIEKVEKMYVAGNTTMLHLFFGVDCASLGVSPYMPKFIEEKVCNAEEINIKKVDKVISLPGISAFVGADIVAGINYVGMAENGYRILLDLGTNAEIVLYSKDKIFCTAAAAGPCFEGANISSGMSATEGAIYSYSSDGTYEVIGKSEAKGLCATGLLDVIKVNVENGEIDESGYLENDPIEISENVSLLGQDIREFQLAKSAIRSAIECLIKKAEIDFSKIEGLFVAGGFSQNLNIENAAYLGLIPQKLKDKFSGINNASLLGTVKYACAEDKDLSFVKKAEYVNLSNDPLFSTLFMEYMMF